jgi:hypothetical protein
MTARVQRTRRYVATLLAFTSVTWTELARCAEPPSAAAIQRHVLELDNGDIIVDVAAGDGAKNGAIVELWRPLRLKHPVTGAEISDQFLIGRLRLTQVRTSLSLARPFGSLARDAEPGDIVVLPGARRAEPERAPTVVTPPRPALPAAPPAPKTETAPRAAGVAGTAPSSVAGDPDAEAIAALLDAVKGKGVKARILGYEDYVRHNPKGRYAAVLWEEAQKLRRLAVLEAKSDADTPALRSFEAPSEALSGRPVTFGIELDTGTGAVLHARNPSEVSYTSTPMQRAGDGYFTVTLPAERVKAPGVEYFIEATTPSGQAFPVVGASGIPFRLSVVDAPQAAPPRHHASVATVWTDYANWNVGHDNDVTWQTEGFVGMRFQDEGVRAMRTGFGVYRGRGGSLSDLDDKHLDGRTVGLTYGYLEGEYGISYFTGLIGRGVVGLQKSGVTGGMQLHLRLGNDQSTNLTLGGEVLGTVGLRGIVELTLATFPKVPVVLRTEITNQPAGATAHGDDAGSPGDSNGKGDVGARAIAQVGYRFLPELTVSVRGSYQGRTINHAGPGVGGAIAYQW